jgi:hypothetical protein
MVSMTFANLHLFLVVPSLVTGAHVTCRKIIFFHDGTPSGTLLSNFTLMGLAKVVIRIPDK